ncbi:MAG: PadR family transcriptional regulator [Anaerolineae bacterium]|nr:PadR family transcriptional regulator [Anaerolineae bacterium]MDW8299463.1 PadR family transcriptional regulator [Anaerolineae bacterium]
MTDAELTLLSLLHEKPCYDHELNRIIEQRGIRRWTAIGTSSMYYVLDKLESQGLVSHQTDANGRRLFSISPAGQGVLQTAIADLLSTARAYDKGFEQGLANLSALKKHQILTALLGRQQDLTLKIMHLRETYAREKPTLPFALAAMYEHRLHMLEAELAWLRDFIPAWEAQAPDEPEPLVEPYIAPRDRQVILPQDPDSIHKVPTQRIPPERMPTPPALRTEIMPAPTKPAESDDSSEDADQP